jgi:hypothetical protein
MRNWQEIVAFDDIDEEIPSYLRKSKVDESEQIRYAGLAKTPIAKPKWIDQETRTAPTPTLARRTYSVATTSGKSIIVPSGFASSIASSWDPGKRSIWFQRKAVIICAIFLAIFIVLIIGAAVFLRDKRENDAMDEVDISDEAALEKMREEREMRKGGRDSRKKDKKRNKKEVVNETASIAEGGDAITTGFVTRWARIPARRLKKRKPKTSSQRSRPSQSEQDVDGGSIAPSPRVSTSGDTQSVRQITTREASPSEEDTNNSSISPNGIESDTQNSHNTLSEADLVAAEAAAEAAAERQHDSSNLDADASDAFPPAYIPSHSRSDSTTRNQLLHPSADRRLMGGVQEGEEGRVDEKASRSDLSNQETAPPLSSLPSGSSNFALSPSGPAQLSAHIATDDKSMLVQLRNAASQPSAPFQQQSAPSYVPAAADAQDDVATAPHFASAPPDVDVTQEELQVIEGSTKGKGVIATTTLLPSPPTPLAASTFSPFDMPYTQPSNVVNTTKTQEAAEEHRKAFALVESRPEDMDNLPRYEGQRQPTVMSTPSAPSAPEEGHDNDAEEDRVDCSNTTSASAPSAPEA